MLSDKLHNLRKQHGYSQTELARLLHVSQSTITSWETAKAVPSSTAIKQLANLFSVSADYLLDIQENKTTPDLSYLNSKEDIFTYEGKKVSKRDIDLIRHILETGEYESDEEY